MTELATLTVAEAEVLADCEQTISHGLQTFVEVGTALSLIRDNRLYRATHATFDAYLVERWQISRPRAYELMTAASAVSGMPDTDRPTNARQAVELARVPEAERAEVWRAANEATDGKPTAAAIRAAATPQTAAARDGAADAAGEGEPSTPTVDPAAAPGPAVQEGAAGPGVIPEGTSEDVRRANWRALFREYIADVRAGREPLDQFLADFPRDNVAEMGGPEALAEYDSLAAPAGPATPAAGPIDDRRQANRRPLPDAANVAGWELHKAIERILRIVEDDRYPRNAEQVATHLRGHLSRAIQTLSEVSDRLPKSQLEVTP